MRYEIFVTVWEKYFVRKFVEIALASQLTPGNLPALSLAANVTYRIYTDRASDKYFKPEVGVLENLVNVEFIYFEELPYLNSTLKDAIKSFNKNVIKHKIQRETSRHHMKLASNFSKTAIMFLDSDFVFSDGSFAHIHEQRIKGKKAYAGMFVRLAEEEAMPILSKHLPEPLSPRQLVQIAITTMHPLPHSMFIDSNEPSIYPTQINWNVINKGFVTHCFFPHPLMFEMHQEIINYFSTMDYEVLLRAIKTDDDLYFCNSSDKLMFCKMSPKSYFRNKGAGVPFSIDFMARFIISETNIGHRLFVQHPIRYIAVEDDNAFNAVEEETKKYVEAIYKTAEIIVANVLPSDTRMMVYLKSFLGPIENYISPQVRSTMRDFLPK